MTLGHNKYVQISGFSPAREKQHASNGEAEYRTRHEPAQSNMDLYGEVG